ncbi:MAG: TetR/AcrR family transcriptional regulator [Desulfuromonadaceae bacterium]
MRISQAAKEETRERILERATVLFLSQGFETTTTRDIATAAGLAAGTLFNYFPSKETLAMSLVREALAEGIADYQRRHGGTEELAEDLFLLVSSGLRRLRPLRPFLGPVLERSLSPFCRKTTCPEGEEARLEHLTQVREILFRHGFVSTPDEVALTIYWSLYLGILAFWTGDETPQQEATRALIDYSLQMFVQTIAGNLPPTGAAHGN